MRIEYLREFLTVARELSFSAAARKLFMSQPALSKHMSAMEDELGAKLLDRSPAGVRLTSEGRAAVEGFEPVVASYDEALRILSLQKSGHARKLSMAFLQYSLDDERYRVSEQIKAIRKDYQIEVQFKDAEEISRGLRDGTLDIALLLDVRFSASDNVARQFVRKQPIALAVMDDDPLCDLDHVTLVNLAGRKLVLPQGATRFAQKLSALFEERGLTVPDIVYSSQKGTQLFTMRRERGVAVVVEMSRENLPAGMSWMVVDDPDATVDMSWMFRRELDDPDLRDFLSRAADILSHSRRC